MASLSDGTGMGCSQLAAMREADPKAKALVFTQFKPTLEWLKVRLRQRGYTFRTICGSMPAIERAQARKPAKSSTRHIAIEWPVH